MSALVATNKAPSPTSAHQPPPTYDNVEAAAVSAARAATKSVKSSKSWRPCALLVFWKFLKWISAAQNTATTVLTKSRRRGSRGIQAV